MVYPSRMRTMRFRSLSKDENCERGEKAKDVPDYSSTNNSGRARAKVGKRLICSDLPPLSAEQIEVDAFCYPVIRSFAALEISIDDGALRLGVANSHAENADRAEQIIVFLHYQAVFPVIVSCLIE